VSVLEVVFGWGSRERIARMLKVDEVFTLQALSDGFALGVRIGSVTRTCPVTFAELSRSRSQFGGPTGFLAGLLNDLARACIDQVEFESWKSRKTMARSTVMPMYTLGSDEPEFVPITSLSINMNMYEELIDDISQGVMAQFAVPADLLNVGRGPIPDEADEPRKNRFERIAEEMLMDEEP
jgi:hypothetical protein